MRLRALRDEEEYKERKTGPSVGDSLKFHCVTPDSPGFSKPISYFIKYNQYTQHSPQPQWHA